MVQHRFCDSMCSLIRSLEPLEPVEIVVARALCLQRRWPRLGAVGQRIAPQPGLHRHFSSRPQWRPGIDPFKWYDEGYRIVHKMRLQFPDVHAKPKLSSPTAHKSRVSQEKDSGTEFQWAWRDELRD